MKVRPGDVIRIRELYSVDDRPSRSRSVSIAAARAPNGSMTFRRPRAQLCTVRYNSLPVV
jgi:hypothetical protein